MMYQDMKQLESLNQALNEWEESHLPSMWSLMLRHVIERSLEIEREKNNVQKEYNA